MRYDIGHAEVMSSHATGDPPAAPPIPAALRGLAHDAVCRACRAARLGGGVDAGVHELVHGACDVARASGVRAEQVVIVLKEGWRAMPEARALPRPAADAALERIVSLSIRAYYEGRPA